MTLRNTKFNYDDISKIDNNILIPLYEKISYKYWNNIKIDWFILNQFIKNWFKIKKYDDFSFNLGLDLYNIINL